MSIATQFAEESENVVAVEDNAEFIFAETIRVEAEEIDKQATSFLTLGKQYKRARDIFPLDGAGRDDRPSLSGINRPGWYDWIDQNLQLKRKQVGRYINAYEAYEKNPKLKNSSVELLAILGSSETPESAVEEISGQIEKGKKVTVQLARDLVKDHKALPTPTEANKIARDENRVVTASDGKLYAGATAAETDEYARRRRQTYGVMEAVTTLTGCDVNGDGWVKQAKDHWIREFQASSIDDAIRFLEDLKSSLDKKRRIIDA